VNTFLAQLRAYHEAAPSAPSKSVKEQRLDALRCAYPGDVDFTSSDVSRVLGTLSSATSRFVLDAEESGDLCRQPGTYPIRWRFVK
jgi:hypothetical protein